MKHTQAAPLGKRRKQALLLAVFAVALLLAVLSILRIVRLNRLYPSPEIVSHRIGEEIRGGDVVLTFTDYKLTSGAAFRKVLPDYTDPVMNADMTAIRDEQRYVLTAYVKVENQSREEKTVSLVQINAESLSWANGIDGGLFPRLNADNHDPMRISLQPGEAREIVLPYSLYDFQFPKKEWAEIENRAFDLTLSFYPVRNIVLLA